MRNRIAGADWSPLTGYDIFISYKRDEASAYAAELAKRLSASDFRCFLDSVDAPPGAPLTSTIRRALRHSKTLVLIVTPRLRESEWIERELEIFAGFGRDIIPIRLGVTDDVIQSWTGPLTVIQERDIVWIDEPHAEAGTGGPSDTVLGGIQSRFRYRRANASRRAILGMFSVLMSVTTAIAAWKWYESSRERDTAVARLLTAQAQRVLLEEPLRIHVAALLALQAIRRTEHLGLKSVEAEQVLEKVVALSPVLVNEEKTDGKSPRMVMSESGALLAIKDKTGCVAVYRMPEFRKEQCLRKHSASVTAIAFDPTESFLVTGDEDGLVTATSIRDWSDAGRLQLDWKYPRFAFDGSGKYLVATGGGSTVLAALPGLTRPWSVPSDESTMLRQTHAIAHSGTTPYMATAHGHHVRLWEMLEGVSGRPATGRLLDTVRVDIVANNLLFNREGNMLAVANGREVVLFGVSRKLSLHRRISHVDQVQTMAFDPKRSHFASGDASGQIIIIDTDEPSQMILAHGRTINSLFFHPVLPAIVSSSNDGTARIWNYSSGLEWTRIVHEIDTYDARFVGDEALVTSLDVGGNFKLNKFLTHGEDEWKIGGAASLVRFFSGDSHVLVGAGSYYFAGIGKSAQLTELPVRIRGWQDPLAIAMPDDAGVVIVGGESISMQMRAHTPVEVFDRRLERKARSDDVAVKAVSAAADAALLGIGTRDDVRIAGRGVLGANMVKVRRLPGLELMRSYHYEAPVNDVALDSTGRFLAATGELRRVEESGDYRATTSLWNIAGDKLLLQLEHRGRGRKVDFAKGGATLLAVTDEPALYFIDTGKGVVKQRMALGDPVRKVAISTNQRYLAILLGERRIAVWNLIEEKLVKTVISTSRVSSIALHDANGLLAVGGVNGDVSIYDIDTGSPLYRTQTGEQVIGLALSDNARLLAVATNAPLRRQGRVESLVRISAWTTADLVNRACQRINRDLNDAEFEQFLAKDKRFRCCE